MTPKQALKMLTVWPAYAAFQEDQLGKIAPGYRADFTVLSQNLLQSAPSQILETTVLFTIVNGDVVYP
ncbi:MAG: amidohydrolase family protein, partial [Fidelibacterota bacterium]